VSPFTGPLGGVREESKGVNPFTPNPIMSEKNYKNAFATVLIRFLKEKKSQSLLIDFSPPNY
jgi:hypothetical protein